MCQLLGMNANTPTDVMFSSPGWRTRADEHKDGFGIAFFEERGAAPVRRPPQRAANSPVAELVRHYPIRSDNVIAHIRKATKGASRWRTRTRSCANCGAATGCSRTTAT